MGQISEEIMLARVRAGLTQSDLSRRLGWDRSVLSRVESGAHHPMIATLVLLARALGAQIVLRVDASGVDASVEPI